MAEDRLSYLFDHHAASNKHTFIAAIRESTGKHTFYQELESLAKLWEKKPLVKKTTPR